MSNASLSLRCLRGDGTRHAKCFFAANEWCAAKFYLIQAFIGRPANQASKAELDMAFIAFKRRPKNQADKDLRDCGELVSRLRPSSFINDESGAYAFSICVSSIPMRGVPEEW
jgi:hypothetical protein